MISVLIPIYNGIEFINQSVNSVINQTYKQFEIIIGVNGHPLNSKVYNEASKFNNDNIKVLDLHYIKGKSNALNEMLKHIQYNWICILDVDDIWLPDKLEKQIPYMKDFDIIGTKCRYFGDKDGSPNIPCGDISTFDFFKGNPIINSSCLVKKELCYWDINRNSGLNDYDMWLRLRSIGKKFYNVNCVLVLHRIHNESAFNAKGNHLKVPNLLSKYKKMTYFVYNFKQGEGGIGDYIKFFVYTYQKSLREGNKCVILKNNLMIEKYIKLKDERLYVTPNQLPRMNNKKIIKPQDLYQYFGKENMKKQKEFFFIPILFLFEFSQEVLDNRNKLLSPDIQDYISLHVRLGDKHIETDSNNKICKNDEREINQDKINECITDNKDTNIILFCDNNEYKQDMKKKFDNIIICNSDIGHTSFKSTTEKQVLDTITEFYIMSESKEIVAGSLSGFSIMASIFNNIPIKFITDKIGEKAHLQ